MVWIVSFTNPLSFGGQTGILSRCKSALTLTFIERPPQCMPLTLSFMICKYFHTHLHLHYEYYCHLLSSIAVIWCVEFLVRNLLRQHHFEFSKPEIFSTYTRALLMSSHGATVIHFNTIRWVHREPKRSIVIDHKKSNLNDDDISHQWNYLSI